VLSEKLSRARSDRPQLRKAITALGKGDVLLVCRLDRLARSTRDLLNILHEVGACGEPRRHQLCGYLVIDLPVRNQKRTSASIEKCPRGSDRVSPINDRRALADRRTHIGRDLRLRERAVVDSHVIDTAGKFKAGAAGPPPDGDIQR